MNTTTDLDEAAKIRAPSVPDIRESDNESERTHVDPTTVPTEEEKRTLRRVSAKIRWITFTVAFIEACERFSYYGTTAVFVNFIQQPLPEGSNTGAGKSGQSGALDMGQQASTGLTTLNQFWAYICPLVGAYMAERFWGRFKTIQISIFIALVGHVVLIISAIPPVIVHPEGAIAAFAIGLIIMGLGVGGFKSNISVLIAEQQTETEMRIETTNKGERVIVDPAVTASRIYLWFYLCINVGSLAGSIAMVWAEKYVGFWLSFLLPTLMLCICPIVMIACKSKYRLMPPAGSVLEMSMRLWSMAIKKRWSWNPIQFRKNVKAPGFWDDVKPSNVAVKPKWMTFDDEWVDEVRRGLYACKVFLWYPLYWLAYNQMTNNLTSQAATMRLNGVPNDIVSNLNPISIILFIPLCDFVIYPALRRRHIHFTPIKRIATGFFLASMAMVSATVVQYYIYQKSPCGNHAGECTDSNGVDRTAPITVWVQIVPYALIGFSEIMASITSLEYAFTKAPKNMRSTVQAVALFMSAFSAALGQALVPLATDPLLIWNYGVVAVIAACGGVLFWLDNRKLDKEEDALNSLPDSKFVKRDTVADSEKGEGEGNDSLRQTQTRTVDK